jgi:hypothetical protein
LSRKNVVVHTLESSQSLAANFNTDPTLVKFLDNCSYQINVTTSNSEGSFQVEASNDYAIYEPTNDVQNSGTWIPLTLAGGTPTVAAQNDTIIINLNQLPFNAIRLSYSSSVAGTGTCSVYLVGKQLG